jgi:hypothetical protein
MLRRVRQQLDLIRYYSASRAETAWTRALEWALLAALLLGLPATLICEELVTRPVALTTVEGTIANDRDGKLFAIVQELGNRVWGAEANPYGEFTLVIENHSAGWPFTTMTQRRPPRLDLNLYAQAGTRRDVKLTAEDPIRMAIEEALWEPEHRDLLATWRSSDEPNPDRIWLTTFVGAALWWVMLSFAAFVSVESLRLLTHFARVHRQKRIAERLARGYCGYCGYNLRGLEFSARCPECGKLVH